jgi:DNA-binding NtrC family response regulator
MRLRVLVVDDEARQARLVADLLEAAGHQAVAVGGGKEALQRLEQERFDVVVTDLRMAPPDGLGVLHEVKRKWPGTEVVLMTAYATVETTRRALQDGASDYVAKEGSFVDEIKVILDRLAGQRELRQQKQALEGQVTQLKKGVATVVGDSPALRQALELAEKVAATDSSVLLRGESGSGKDLFARAIHFASRRAGGPWVKVNCGALPENLLESELFGYEKGAFTGAQRTKPGRFEDAHGGTIFLDEIGELTLALQVKLLQVLEEKTFNRLGGNQSRTVDVRILAATNRDLEEAVAKREFREDLFFRLNVFPIRIPPLRERLGDVAPLAAHVLAKHGAPADKLTPEALGQLQRYAYPGNVRELEHTLERALILAGSDPIRVEHLSFVKPLTETVTPGWIPAIPPEGLSLERLEKELILKALEQAGGNKSQAARLLGLTRRTLYSRMEKHGLHAPGEGEEAAEAAEAEGS